MEARTLLSVVPFTTPPSSTILTLPFPANLATSTIDGTVFTDTNNNGLLDIADARIPFALVYVDVNNNNVPEPTDEIVQADADGDFRLFVPAGTFNVRVEPIAPQILEPTSPGLQPITVARNDQFVGANFAFLNPATVSGTVYGDTNGNGIQDTGEAGVPGRTVYADVNNDGAPDAGDQFGTTDANGNYTITGLNSGTYTIRLDVPAGSHQTAPVSGVYRLSITAGQSATGNNFGLAGPDLTIQLLSAPPAQIIGGAKQKPLVVSVTNVGASTISNLVGVSLYASVDATLDPTDIPLSGLLGRKTTLKPGQSRTFRVPLMAPTTVPTATYKILARVISSVPDENAANDVAAAGINTRITKPFTDLSVAYGAQPAEVFDYATPAAIGIIVTNHGNVEFDGFIRVTAYVSPDITLQNASNIARTRSIKVRILPNQSHGIILPIVFTGVQRGVYFIIATADVSAVVGDVNTSNNIAISQFPSDIH